MPSFRCLRLSGLYLAGFALIVLEMFLQLAAFTRGSEGLKGQPAPAIVLTTIFMPFGLSGATRRYGHRWFGIGAEPIIPRRLGY